MMPKRNFCTGLMYSSDQWTDYWEGTRKRDNENIGEVTTTSITYMGNYGITDRLNVIAMLPYIKTEASGGTMTGMKGIQDLTVALKYQLVSQEAGPGTLKAFGALSYTQPLGNYTPDFLPLSIGLRSKNIGYRINAYYQITSGWFANASGGYTWRSNVRLDRTSYYTDGQLFMTNEVEMPNVADVFASAGYNKNGIQAELNVMVQRTLGGADIRRQDMPFVSNQMDFVKGGVLVMYYPKFVPNLAIRGAYAYTFSGRNVGQSTTITAGVLYTFKFLTSAE